MKKNLEGNLSQWAQVLNWDENQKQYSYIVVSYWELA